MTAATTMLDTISDTGRGNGSSVEDTPSVSLLSSLETLLATMCADVNEWAAGWCKVLAFVKTHKTVPKQLSELDLDVPQNLRYMLTTDSSRSGGVKAETVSGSPVKGAKDGSGTDPSSSRSQSMQLGCVKEKAPIKQFLPCTSTTTTGHNIHV